MAMKSWRSLRKLRLCLLRGTNQIGGDHRDSHHVFDRFRQIFAPAGCKADGLAGGLLRVVVAAADIDYINSEAFQPLCYLHPFIQKDALAG